MTDLNRLLARQNFKDEKEMQAFLNQFLGKPLSNLPKMDLKPEEQAQDLVFEAYKLNPAKASKNIEKALELDPDCIEVYEYLASRERKGANALPFFEKGIEIGQKKFGGKFLQKNKGNFWGWHETRPYMRCLYNKAEILVITGKIAEGVAIMEEMLELNTGDNQGVRFPLFSALIRIGETEKFKKYDKMFADDIYSAQILYSRALFAFKTEGDSVNANELLKNAYKNNPYVVRKLLDKYFQFKGVNSYAMGSPEEAEVYLIHALFAWRNTEGAIAWIADKTGKLLNKKK
jgi:tetratricopeptide (TPR) repeat protein